MQRNRQTLPEKRKKEKLDNLNLLGLNEDLFSKIGERVFTAYSSTTKNDAVSAPGTYAYYAAIRAIRDILQPHGWERERLRYNLEAAVNNGRNVRILVSSADSFTGRNGRDPRTRNPKGSRTQKIVYDNSPQGLLFPEMERVNFIQQPTIPTWFFLYYIDHRIKEMRMELSLPVTFDLDKSKITGWAERIKFDPFEFENYNAEPEKQEYAPEEDFEIERRQNE